jgi:uncharacterized protein YfbU (UPF0304 family)
MAIKDCQLNIYKLLIEKSVSDSNAAAENFKAQMTLKDNELNMYKNWLKIMFKEYEVQTEEFKKILNDTYNSTK